jgi:hypothetical protein
VLAVFLDIIETGGTLEKGVEAMIEETIKGGNISGAASISVNEIPTTIYQYAKQFVWRGGGRFMYVGVQKVK